MEPQSDVRRRPAKPGTGIILGTGVVLVLAFIALIVLFFIISALTPNLVGKCVAVMTIDQELTTEGAPTSLFGDGIAGSEEIAYGLESLNKRDDVGAVVIVLNSPGGSIVATREVYDAVKGLDKPSVAYFREVAASGAYYVATGTDYIISDPNAITGSIGVITTFTEMEGLLDKLGINVTVVKSGKFKDIGSPYRNMTEEELEIIQSLNNEVFEEFKTIVLQNRGTKLDMNQFNNITDARIMTGRQALRVGLVDEVGNKKDAILKAAQLAGIEADSIDDVRVCSIPTSYGDSSVFSLESLVKRLETYSNIPKISYK